MTKVKPEERIARFYADRLILREVTELYEVVKPSEIAERLNSVGLGLGTIRSLLASNEDMFAYHERRWIPAARVASADRPISAAITECVRRFYGPVPLSLVVAELVRTRSMDVEAAQKAIERLAKTSREFFHTRSGQLCASEYAFVATDESIERAYDVNRIQAEDVEEAEKKLGTFDWTAPGAIHQALKQLHPVSAKVLGAIAWRALNPQEPTSVLQYDWRAFNAELFAADAYVYGADGKMHEAKTAEKWIKTASRVAEKIAPTIEIEDAAPLELKPEDVETMVSKILAADETVTAISMLEELFEITKSVKTFPDDLANVMGALRADQRVWWVGGDRFRKPDTAPDFIYAVPEPFDFVQTEHVDAEGEAVDAELHDEGLSTSLRKLLAHPLATDVNDEDYAPAPKTQPESMRLVLKSIHRELGTFPMCQFPTGWFDPEPEVQELIFIDPEGRELQVWLNHKARLIFDLLDWWLDQPVESGAVFSVTKTAKPNVFEFEWLDQTDPIVYVSNQRMEELREIAAEAEGKSTFELLRRVMEHWPKGADFLTILWELNVVRRTSRRMVASLLSSYLCFYQRSGSPVWHYDQKKVEQGFDKTKRKFVKS